MTTEDEADLLKATLKSCRRFLEHVDPAQYMDYDGERIHAQDVIAFINRTLMKVEGGKS